MIILLALLFLVIIPAGEIYLFIKVGAEIGAGTTVWLTILSAIMGIYFVKKQGAYLLKSARNKMNEDRIPTGELFGGLCIAVAGIFLFLPGFITDSIGVLLLIPPVRSFLRTLIIDEILGAYTFGMVDSDTIRHGKKKYNNYKANKEISKIQQNGVIDAEFTVDDEKNKPPKGG